MDDIADEAAASVWDPLVERLQTLRLAAGEPSYAEIAQRVSTLRLESSRNPLDARVPRSTVYDTFRPGRTRLNTSLVRDIATVLGADPSDVDQWVASCRDTSPPPAPTEPVPDPVEVSPTRVPRGRIALLMVCCIALNLVGREVVDFLQLPVYLDMTGTAVAAIALGPWRGAAVGLSTNVMGVIGSGWVSLPFAAVNIVGALVWGYGVRRFGLGRTLGRFFVLSILVALACTLVATAILMWLDGSVGQGQDTITATFLDLTGALVIAVGLSNLLTSMADKIISGFVALVILSALPEALRHWTPDPVIDAPDIEAPSRTH